MKSKISTINKLEKKILTGKDFLNNAFLDIKLKVIFNNIIYPEIGDIIEDLFNEIKENIKNKKEFKYGESKIFGECINITSLINARFNRSSNKNILSFTIIDGVFYDEFEKDDGYLVDNGAMYSCHTIGLVEIKHEGDIYEIYIDLTPSQFFGYENLDLKGDTIDFFTISENPHPKFYFEDNLDDNTDLEELTSWAPNKTKFIYKK